MLVRDLIHSYLTDRDSPVHKLRYVTRQNYIYSCSRINDDYGDVDCAAIRARTLLGWHQIWVGPNGHITTAHRFIGMLRTLFGFGATYIEDRECERLCGVLHRMRFTMSKPRRHIITAEQVIAIRQTAHAMGLHSVALAQTLQFELMLRQKDCVGEWVPMSEPGASDVLWHGQKWLRGLRWSEIDANMVLRHVTSKRNKEIEVDLTLAPMLMEELRRIDAIGITLAGTPTLCHTFRTQAPIVVNEATARPYMGSQFRRAWRRVAVAAGVPTEVYNMDSRAGAISEAASAGAPMEHVRQAATHSDLSTTMGYSRESVKSTATVMQIRAASRQVS